MSRSLGFLLFLIYVIIRIRYFFCFGLFFSFFSPHLVQLLFFLFYPRTQVVPHHAPINQCPGIHLGEIDEFSYDFNIESPGQNIYRSTHK